nr:PTS sugar transporter subunit IIC [Enterococcus avium]
MKISFIQAILIGVVYYLGVTGTPWLSLLGSISFMQKPLVAGTVVGIILGDPVQGVIIGAAIQLPYIAFISAGGTAPVDPGCAPCMSENLVVKVHYRLGSRNC